MGSSSMSMRGGAAALVGEACICEYWNPGPSSSSSPSKSLSFASFSPEFLPVGHLEGRRPSRSVNR